MNGVAWRSGRRYLEYTIKDGNIVGCFYGFHFYLKSCPPCCTILRTESYICFRESVELEELYGASCEQPLANHCPRIYNGKFVTAACTGRVSSRNIRDEL